MAATINLRNMDAELARTAKTFAASQGWTLKHVVTTALREYLERKGIYGRPETLSAGKQV